MEETLLIRRVLSVSALKLALYFELQPVLHTCVLCRICHQSRPNFLSLNCSIIVKEIGLAHVWKLKDQL